MSINRLGGWKTFLVNFQLLEEVPSQHKGAWCTAWKESLVMYKNAKTTFEANTALMWMSFWPQGLLRKPIRGGRHGRSEIASRFHAVIDGNWEFLIDKWERDSKKRSDFINIKNARMVADKDIDYEKSLTSQRKKVIALIQAGLLSKAMNRVTSHGLGNLSDPSTILQLSKKFPQRSRPLPEAVSIVKPIDGFKGLRETLLSLNSGTAPGAGGLRHEFLHALGERMEDEEIKLLEDFGMLYCSGELPAWFYLVWQSVQTVAPYKDARCESVRPLGLKNNLVKLLN